MARTVASIREQRALDGAADRAALLVLAEGLRLAREREQLRERAGDGSGGNAHAVRVRGRAQVEREVGGGRETRAQTQPGVGALVIVVVAGASASGAAIGARVLLRRGAAVGEPFFVQPCRVQKRERGSHGVFERRRGRRRRVRAGTQLIQRGDCRRASGVASSRSGLRLQKLDEEAKARVRPHLRERRADARARTARAPRVAREESARTRGAHPKPASVASERRRRQRSRRVARADLCRDVSREGRK